MPLRIEMRVGTSTSGGSEAAARAAREALEPHRVGYHHRPREREAVVVDDVVAEHAADADQHARPADAHHLHERAERHDRRDDEEDVGRLAAKGEAALADEPPELARHVGVGPDDERDVARDTGGDAERLDRLVLVDQVIGLERVAAHDLPAQAHRGDRAREQPRREGGDARAAVPLVPAPVARSPDERQVVVGSQALGEVAARAREEAVDAVAPAREPVEQLRNHPRRPAHLVRSTRPATRSGGLWRLARADLINRLAARPRLRDARRAPARRARRAAA